MKKIIYPLKKAALVLSMVLGLQALNAQNSSPAGDSSKSATPGNPVYCDLQSNVSLGHTQISCNTHIFTPQFGPGYSPLFIHWTLDGNPVTGGLSEYKNSELPPGTHTVCAAIMGGINGNPDDVCCAKICKGFTINGEVLDPAHKSSVLDICPFIGPNGPVFNPCSWNLCNSTYFDYWKNGVLILFGIHMCFLFLPV